MVSSVQPHRRKIVHNPAPVQADRYGGSYIPPAQSRYAVADVVQDPLLALTIAMAGPRPSPRYGSSARVRPLAGTERTLRDAATYSKQTGHPVKAALYNVGREVVGFVNDNIGPVVGIVAGGSLATVGVSLHSDIEPDNTEPEKERHAEPDKEPAKVPLIKETVEKEPVKKTEVQEYKAPERMDPVKTVAKGRSHVDSYAASDQAAQAARRVGDIVNGGVDSTELRELEGWGPHASHLERVYNALGLEGPNGRFAQRWKDVDEQIGSNLTTPGTLCSAVVPGSIRYDGAQEALGHIGQIKQLLSQAGVDPSNPPVQQPTNFPGLFAYKLVSVLKGNEAAINKALADQCTQPASSFDRSIADPTPGVESVGAAAKYMKGIGDWARAAGADPRLERINPFRQGPEGLAYVQPEAEQQAGAAVLTGIRPALDSLFDQNREIGASPAPVAIYPSDTPPIIDIEGVEGDQYVGREVTLLFKATDPQGKMKFISLQVGEQDPLELPVKADGSYSPRIKIMEIGNTPALIKAKDSQWDVTAQYQMIGSDPVPQLDAWDIKSEQAEKDVSTLYIKALVKDSNFDTEKTRVWVSDMRGSGFNADLVYNGSKELNGQTVHEYVGKVNVRLRAGENVREIGARLNVKDGNNEAFSPDVINLKVERQQDPIPNPGGNGNGNHTNNTNNTTINQPPDIQPNAPTPEYLKNGAIGGGLLALLGGVGYAQKRWGILSRAAEVISNAGRRGNGAKYAPLAAGSPADAIKYIAYMGPGGRTMISEPTTRGRDLLSTTSRIDPDLAGGMAQAILDGMGQALGGSAEKAVVNIKDVGTARYMRGSSGDVLCIVTEPGPHETEIEGRMERALMDVAGLVPEIRDWGGDIKDIDPRTGEQTISPLVQRVRGVLGARIIRGEDPLLSMPVPSGLSGTQGEAERPAAAGEIHMKPPETVLPKSVEPAEGFEPPIRRGTPREGESYGTVEPAPAPTPSFVMPPGPVDVPAQPPQDDNALRMSMKAGMRVPAAAPGVGMHPGVPGNGVAVNGNGGGEPVDVDGIIGRLRLGKGETGKSGAER